MSVFKFAAAAILALSLASCAGNPENGTGAKENTGTLVGALGGAAIGCAIRWWGRRPCGGRPDRCGCGRADRQSIGAALDDDDKRRAYAAEMEALDSGPSGAPVGWRNPDSGRYGSVVPGPAYVQEGRNCRAYTETIYIDGRPQTARGTACRNPDGSWTPLG